MTRKGKPLSVAECKQIRQFYGVYRPNGWIDGMQLLDTIDALRKLLKRTEPFVRYYGGTEWSKVVIENIQQEVNDALK